MEETQSISIELSTWAIVTFIAYLLIIIGIGIYSSRFSSQGLANYFIGGRKMNRLVVALSAVVSGRSAWLLLGFTGMAYTQGASVIWAAVGYTIVEFLLFFYFAPRLRTFTEKYNSITLPDFFSDRFNDKKGYLRILLVVIIIIFMVSYVAAQFVAGGKTFASSFQMDQNTGVYITAGIVLLYTVLGGFLAVSLTDMIQAFFMVFALLILPILAISDIGGWSAVLSELQAYDPSFMDPAALTFGALIGFLGIGLGSPGNPHILIRYMSIDDPKQLRYSAYVGTTWNILMAAGAILIGIAGRVVFPEVGMLPNDDPENLYPLLAQQQFNPILFGLVVASIFAAIMSTCDSQLLVAASSVVRDVYDRILHKDEELPQKKLVKYSRWVVVILVVIGLVLGLLASKLVFWLVLFAWAGLGAALGPAAILALFWKGTTRQGIIAGIITGAVTTIVWYNIPVLKDSLYELIPGLVLNFLVTIVVSKMTKPPEKADEMFDTMKGEKIDLM